MVLKNERGQTMVEYILLLAVSISLVATFYRSDAFQRLFGTRGQLGESMKNGNEFSYRHALGRKPEYVNTPKTSRDASRHPSYYNGKENKTRFFGPKDPYPSP